MDELQVIEDLKQKWMYKNAIKETWAKSSIIKTHNVLILEFHTMGTSHNEEIVKRLEKTSFWRRWWWKIERGGHYYFEIDFTQMGFKLVAEMAKETGVTRQYIHKTKDKYDWVIISPSKRLIRRKDENT